MVNTVRGTDGQHDTIYIILCICAPVLVTQVPEMPDLVAMVMGI